jgi:hypothetical protein
MRRGSLGSPTDDLCPCKGLASARPDVIRFDHAHRRGLEWPLCTSRDAARELSQEADSAKLGTDGSAPILDRLAGMVSRLEADSRLPTS